MGSEPTAAGGRGREANEWTRACTLPVADEVQAQWVLRSVNEEGAPSPTRAPSIANGQIGERGSRAVGNESAEHRNRKKLGFSGVGKKMGSFFYIGVL